LNYSEAQQRFDNIVLNDPIKLHRYAQSKRQEQYTRYVYMLLVAIPILILLSFLFYVVASMDGAVFGTPEDEVDSIIAQKMEEIVSQGGGESSSGVGHVGDSFQKIQMGLKLIPNMDQHTFLLKRMSLVGQDGETGLDGDVEYNMEAVGSSSSLFFEWTGAQHMNFPELVFDERHVPVGDSVSMCLGLSWTTLKKRNQYDKYIGVQGFEECLMHTRGRSQEEPEYPRKGVNFKLWKQHVAKGDSACHNGIYVPQSDNCYTYQVLSQLCVLVKFDRDIEKNTYSWVTTGGCYKDGESVYYSTAYPNEKFNFRNT